MGDETTSTSITGGQDPVYTTSLTSTIGRPPRKLYFSLQVAALAVTLGLCWLHGRVHGHSEAMELRDLSQVTEVVHAVGKLLSTPIGLACAVFVVVGLGLLAVRGALDGFLKLLIWLNVLWLLAFLVVSTMGLWLPLLKGKPGAGP
jgi:hypothetical protein